MHKNLNIPLARDTISKTNIDSLIGWLQTNPILTKNKLTIEFENKWSEYIGCKYSVYVNSGSSANLAMIYALIQSKKLKNNKIILPAVSWTTTVTPAIQFGMMPILCECDKETLGLDIKHLEQLFAEHSPAALMLVHVLAFPCKMDEILQLCKKYDVILLEDSCESIDSTYKGIKTGNFGLMSTFSFYYGHHMSTIEGGMVCTNDADMYRLLISLRSHGWDRDLDKEYQKQLRQENNVTDFRALYTFYYPGFNLRSTDLQAFLGIEQLKTMHEFSLIRNRNFKIYQSNIKNDFWKITDNNYCFYSNFSYPIITPKINELVQELKKYNVESRPLICGSIGKQPYWINLYGEQNLEFANLVHDCGLYLPNNHLMLEDEVLQLCEIVNSVLNEK
jgi:CDP-6-deoxy-D-xylo-4-hexulose-3-dehydrase